MALASASPAHADFRLCNNTGSRVGIALGYKDAEGWITEGWWNISARSCETLLRGSLVARYYYIYAVDYDRGGEWSGHAYISAIWWRPARRLRTSMTFVPLSLRGTKLPHEILFESQP